MNILGYLQKVGRALMVPVATLPAAAILMGVGYWIDPVAWGGNSALAAFFIKSGGSSVYDKPHYKLHSKDLQSPTLYLN